MHTHTGNGKRSDETAQPNPLAFAKDIQSDFGGDDATEPFIHEYDGSPGARPNTLDNRQDVENSQQGQNPRARGEHRDLLLELVGSPQFRDDLRTRLLWKELVRQIKIPRRKIE